jgi:hypothetical protein
MIRCVGCGGEVPDVDGPTHAYIEASPGCWELFGELGVRFVPGAPSSVVHVGDAYAVQHPGGAERDRRQRQSVAVHLIALCLLHESALPPEEAIPVRRRALEVVLPRFGLADWPYLTPPAPQPSVTAVDLYLATDVEYGPLLEQWLDDAWSAWSAHHPTIRAWAAAVRAR